MKGGKVAWADTTYSIPALADMMRAYPEHWEFFEGAVREELASSRQTPMLSGDEDVEGAGGYQNSTESVEEEM